MTRFNVTGMSCVVCSGRVEKVTSAIDGVTSCSVNLMTGELTVEGTASPDVIIAAIEKAGYGATLKEAPQKKAAPSPSPKKQSSNESSVLIARLISSAIILIPLMYVSMGHGMFGFPLPRFLTESCVSIGLAQLILSAAVLVINQKFFVNAFRSLRTRTLNMDTLVSLGSGTSFIYSTVLLFISASAEALGNSTKAAEAIHGMYFESAAMILTLITLGKLLESRAKGKTTNALQGLMDLSPATATVIKSGTETEVPLEEVRVGDLFTVRPGGRFPVDGVITKGSCAVDESSLTGESIPVDKGVGDSVSASSINTTGYIVCRATRVGEDTTLAQIIRTVTDAAATKAPIARLADKVAGIFVPAVVLISLITLAVWLAVGQDAGFAMGRAITVLVISCPCALGLATPVAIVVGSGVGAKNGILFKTASAIEAAGRINTVVLDKTGTITEGKPAVTDIVAADGFTDDELLSIAYSLEMSSEHPLAKAVVQEAVKRGISASHAENFKAVAGGGIEGTIDNVKCAGGKADFIKNHTSLTDSTINLAETLSGEGKTPLYFTRENRFAGIIAVADTLKSDSADAIREMKKMGLRVVMLTGDNAITAKAVGDYAGITEVISDVLPVDKAEVVEKLKQNGKVAMVGDGINDSPALVTSDFGVAIGAGVDIAVDSADAVLVKNSLSDMVSAIKLGRATLRSIKENLFWAFIYNVIGIPLAAGVFIHLFNFEMSPMIASAAMSLSSVCVISNALRLNTVKLGFKKTSAND